MRGRAMLLVVCGFGLAAVALKLSADRAQPASAPTSTQAAIVYAGMGNQSTTPFYLEGGSYRGQWSAWGRAAEYPPCTHSAELMAVDSGNATPTRTHVVDLASLVQVPATGASDQTDVMTLEPGYYLLRVTSACAWQIAIGPI
jgi:hypothetical protein